MNTLSVLINNTVNVLLTNDSTRKQHCRQPYITDSKLGKSAKSTGRSVKGEVVSRHCNSTRISLRWLCWLAYLGGCKHADATCLRHVNSTWSLLPSGFPLRVGFILLPCSLSLHCEYDGCWQLPICVLQTLWSKKERCFFPPLKSLK